MRAMLWNIWEGVVAEYLGEGVYVDYLDDVVVEYLGCGVRCCGISGWRVRCCGISGGGALLRNIYKKALL